MTDLRNTDNENVFFEVIAQALSKAQDDAKANKSVLLKLSTKDIAALRRFAKNRCRPASGNQIAVGSEDINKIKEQMYDDVDNLYIDEEG